MKSPFRLLREGNPTAIGVLLVALVIGTFLPCLRHDFVNFDDNVYVYENARVPHGLTWGSIGWAFTTLEGGFWHPLTWLSLLLDGQLFGMRSGGYHLTSLLLHAANTVLLFVLFRRLTGAPWRSAFVAALFAVHPLHVEAVAWIASRKDVLSTFFGMLTLLTYVRYATNAEPRAQNAECGIPNTAPRTADHVPDFTLHVSRFTRQASPFYALSLLCFVCGLMSKAMLVTLPLILLLLDWWPLGRFRSAGPVRGIKGSKAPPASRPSSFVPRHALGLFVEKLPFLAASVACGLLTVHAEKAVGAMHTMSDVPLLYRMANATLAGGRYLLQMIWPNGLAVFYPYPSGFAVWPVVGCGLLLLLISALVWWTRRQWPYLAFGWIWYSVTLLPVSGLIQVGSHSHADRYTYVSLVGIFVMLAWGAYDLTKRWPRQAASLSAAAGIVLLLLLPLTRRQLYYWKDSESLFRHALAVTADNSFAQNNFGLALLQRGQVEEAITHFKKAMDATPEYSRPRNNLGIALLEKGRTREAIAQFQAAHELSPDSADVCYNLGVALLRDGQPQQAIAPFQKAVQTRSDFTKARYGLGSALLRTGRTGEAIAQFRKTLELDPDYAEAHSDLGLALLRQGQVDEAIAEFRQALKIRPDSAETCYNLGISLLRKGRPDEAIPHLQRAVAIQPSLTEAQIELAKTLIRAGQVDEAILHYKEAVQSNPKLTSAQSDLASRLLSRGRAAEAMTHYQAAIDAQPGNAYLLNNLAWVLATSPQSSVRNGARAVELAEQAERLSGGRNPSILGTLAAAYAESGRFPEAVTTAQRASEIALAQTNTAQVVALKAQVALYRAGSPFRDTAQTSTPPKSGRSDASSQ